jgi:hypothetical protein
MNPVLRAKSAWIKLPDGRQIRGHIPGQAGQQFRENILRDELARRVQGITEAVLPYGRADVMSQTTVFEVEPAANFRFGIRQVLAYSAQCGLPPALALFGDAHHTAVLKMYLKLRDGHPPIELWWHSDSTWWPVTSRRACRNMRDVIQDRSTEARDAPAV